MKIIFCDGLTGNGWRFRRLIEYIGHDDQSRFKTEIADTRNILSHDDRVDAVLAKVSDNTDDNQPIVFVGFSAGASAIRLSIREIQRLRNHPKIVGLIMISPAMPRGIPCFTLTLTRYMVAHMIPIMLSVGEIKLPDHQLLDLIGPVEGSMKDQLIENATGIGLSEARRLAFWPPENYSVGNIPILYVYGNRDRWVSPRAHRKFISKISTNNNVEVQKFNCGHDPLISPVSDEVMVEIKSWIKKL